jgi:quercetin dioxygenase-like cupin family protein
MIVIRHFPNRENRIRKIATVRFAFSFGRPLRGLAHDLPKTLAMDTSARPLTMKPIWRRLGVYTIILDTAKLPWTSLDFPGVSIRKVHEDKKSGGVTVLTRLEAGASIPAHLHTKADETVFVLAGDFIEDDVEYGPGSFFAAPAGVSHGPHQSRSGCIVLTTFSAPLDFQNVD